MEVLSLSLPSLIEVADYSSVRSSFGRMTNKSFIEMMNNDGAEMREPWVKVRWINIGGVDWGVLSALALKYGMSDYFFLNLCLRHGIICRQTCIPSRWRMSCINTVMHGPKLITIINISFSVSFATRFLTETTAYRTPWIPLSPARPPQDP